MDSTLIMRLRFECGHCAGRISARNVALLVFQQDNTGQPALLCPKCGTANALEGLPSQVIAVLIGPPDGGNTELRRRLVERLNPTAVHPDKRNFGNRKVAPGPKQRRARGQTAY